jgi:hypothetical protein
MLLKYIKVLKNNAQKRNKVGDEEYYEEVWMEQKSGEK